MTEKKPKAVAITGAVYKIASQHNHCIRTSDPFTGRIQDHDWALCLGGGEYQILAVSGYQVTGLPNYRFHATPMSAPLRWKPTVHEDGLLRGGLTIEAPMDLMQAAQAIGLLPPSEPHTNGDTPRYGVPARQTPDGAASV